MTRRGDFVVILARGASRRMGQPKGLLTCDATGGEKFLTEIVRQYDILGLTGVVVATDDLLAGYAAVLPAKSRFRVVGYPPGGETGRTLLHGWEEAVAGTTHLWAHPVDLPLVGMPALARLEAESKIHPERLVRPAHDGEPGHPVIVPVAVMTALQGHPVWQAAPMREVIALAHQMGHIGEPLLVPVSDPGVVTDFDCPGDLDAK